MMDHKYSPIQDSSSLEKASLTSTTTPVLERGRRLRRTLRSDYILAGCAFFLFGLLLLWSQNRSSVPPRRRPELAKVEQCAIDNLHEDLGFLHGVEGLRKQDFVERRDVLADVLVQHKIQAFAAELGSPSSQYYVNISNSDLATPQSSSPSFMLIMPYLGTGSQVFSRTIFIVPQPSKNHMRSLNLPGVPSTIIVEGYGPDESPYDKIMEQFHAADMLFPSVVLADDMPQKHADALMGLKIKCKHASVALALVRQVKTEHEVDILRAVNTGTAAAIRALQPCLVPGLREMDVSRALTNTIQSLPNFNNVYVSASFDEQAAMHYCGRHVSSARLTYESLVTIEASAKYLGFSSKVSRTFFINSPKGRVVVNEDAKRAKEHAWDVALQAQKKAVQQMVEGASSDEPGRVAEKWLHQKFQGLVLPDIGHGVGVSAEEGPSLCATTRGERLQAGMVFSIQPEINIKDKYKIKQGDVYVITTEGKAELLTGKTATSLYEP